MEIVWHGLSCFRILERGRPAIVTDPFHSNVGLDLPKLKAGIVTISHNAVGHGNVAGVTGYSHALSGPGEYEIGGIFITGIATHQKGNRNVHFVFDVDGIVVAHLGDLMKVPTQAQIEAMGEVNVLLLPVGGGNSLNAIQAAEVVSMIEPNIVIPMHYQLPNLTVELDGVERFLKEMGVSDAEPGNSLRVSNSSLSEETQTVVLNARS